MLKILSIKNFKSLVDIELNFSNFNLVTGTNSSGKSSLLQSLLVFTQRDEKDLLNGKAVSLGTIKNVVNENTDKYGCSNIKVLCDDNQEYEVEFNKIDGVKCLTNNINSHLYEKDIFYINANRSSVRDTYSKNIYNNSILGTNGEYTFDYYLEKKEKRFVEKYYEALLGFNEKPVYESVVNYWLEKLTGYKVEVNDIDNTNILQVSYYKGDLNNNTIKYRPQHVGTGVSYILEQLIISILSKEGDVIIVENPELHLHPHAQNQLAAFYFWLSENGRQIIIETHSDHFFNAVRVKKASNPHDKTKKVFFFYQEGDETKVLDVEMKELGIISNMRPDLFDQFSNDLGLMVQPIHSSGTDYTINIDDSELSLEEFEELRLMFNDILEED
ncbi:TPA: AAA family ATPase [Streptococcus suis]|nr:AAA family ATPase [Streptococcus suis]